jgi:ParB-like chromosome segregation protein Spo0J
MTTFKELSDNNRSDTFKIPLDLCHEPDWWERDDSPILQDHIRALADSIKEEGIKEPLAGYIDKGILILTSGRCRIRAAKLARSEGSNMADIVPVRAEPRNATEKDLTMSILTRNASLAHTAIEQSKIVKKLLLLGVSREEVMRRGSITPGRMDIIIRLCDAPESVREMVSEGEIAPTTAVNVLRREGKDRGVTVLQEAVDTAQSEGKKKAPASSVNQERKDYKPALLPTLDDPQDIANTCYASGFMHGIAEMCSGFSLEQDEQARKIIRDSGIDPSLACEVDLEKIRMFMPELRPGR